MSNLNESKFKMKIIDEDTDFFMEANIQGETDFPGLREDLAFEAAIQILEHIHVEEFVDYKAMPTFYDKISKLRVLISDLEEHAAQERRPISVEYVLDDSMGGGYDFYEGQKVEFMDIEVELKTSYDNDDEEYHPILTLKMLVLEEGPKFEITWHDDFYEQYRAEHPKILELIEEGKNELQSFLY